MRRGGRGGSVVNIITMASHGGAPELLAYASSKGALATFTRNAGSQLRADRIRVNGLNIGWTATEGEHVVQTGEGEADDWLAAADAEAPARAAAAPGRGHRADRLPPAQRRRRDGHRLGDRLRPDRARDPGVRIWLSGAGGFVGSNLAEVFAASGAELCRAAARGGRRDRRGRRRPQHRGVRRRRGRALRDPQRARRASPSTGGPPGTATSGATRNVVDAANRAGAQVVLISTDWVFDGTQAPGDRGRAAEPGQRVRLPEGRLRARRRGARRPGRGRRGRGQCQGMRPAPHPRTRCRVQDEGFGYLVASLVDALRAGQAVRLGVRPASIRSPRRRSPPTWGTLILRMLKSAGAPGSTIASAASTRAAGSSRARPSTRFGLDERPPCASGPRPPHAACPCPTTPGSTRAPPRRRWTSSCRRCARSSSSSGGSSTSPAEGRCMLGACIVPSGTRPTS